MFSTELKKVIAFASFWGLVFIFFYFSFWNPGIGSLKKTRERINLNQGVLTQIKKDVESWPKTLTAEKLKNAEEELQELFAKIPPEEDIPGILEHIQKYGAMMVHLNITGITNITTEDTKQKRNEDEEEETPYAKVTYKLTADGNFLNVIRFLRGLETSERLIVIEDLNLKRETGEKNNVETHVFGLKGALLTLQAEVTLSLFYSKPELGLSEATSSN